MTATKHEGADELDTEQPSVLVVDDEESLADLYADFLSDWYDVTTVYGGEAALDVVDSSFDVVLLDRQMPDCTGDEVLDEIRARNLECRVAMVTAVDPDLDVIEMPFDDYVVKPVSGDDLHETVAQLLMFEAYDKLEYELSSLQVKRNVLKAELRDDELRESDRFRDLQARIEELQTYLSDLRARLDDDTLAARSAA